MLKAVTKVLWIISLLLFVIRKVLTLVFSRMIVLRVCGDLWHYVMIIVKIIMSILVESVGQTVMKVMIIMVPLAIRISSIGILRAVIYLEALPILRRHAVMATIKVELFATEIVQKWVWKIAG
jgi:hypothetical protein